MTSRSKTIGYWALWALVIFVAFNLGATRQQYRETARQIARPDWRWTPSNMLRALRAYWSEGGSTHLYYTYNNAALGRPVQTKLIRSARQWFEHFEATHAGKQPRLTARHIEQRQVPYRDYLVEYPPGFFLWTMPVAAVAAAEGSYRLLHSLLMGALLTLALVFCLRIITRCEGTSALDIERRLRILAPLALLLVGVVAVRRYDAVVSFTVCGALLAAVRQRFVLAGVALGLGIASKGVPLLVAPPLALLLLFERDLRGLAVGAGVAFAVCGLIGAALLLFTGDGIVDSLRYHAIRPLQIESTFGLLAALFDPGGTRIVHSFGGFNIIGGLAGTLRPLTTPALLLLVLVVYVLLWRALLRTSGRRTCLLLGSAAAVLAAWSTLGAVFSTQFVVWLLPLGLAASLVDDRRFGVWLLLAVCLLTQVIYPFGYHLLLQRSRWLLSLTLLRNVLLLAWIAWLLIGFSRLQPEGRAEAEGGSGSR